MRMGAMERDLSGEHLDFLKAIGVNHVCKNAEDDFNDYGFGRLGYWDTELVADVKRHIESHGLQLDMMTLPLNSPSIERSPLPNILLTTPERDAEIERLIRCIRAAARAGVPAVKFNFTIGGVLRTQPEVGRAGAIHTAFDYDTYTIQPTRAGQISADEMWGRLAYLLDRLRPAVDDAGIRISLHPHDPAVPLGVGMDDRILRDIPSL